MKILALADVESRYLWDFFEKTKLDGIDLILSAGDLAPQYLEFLATYSKVPILYVHGNHDGCYNDTPPGGCICVDGDIYEYQGLRIMGLGGSMCYNYSGFQYTDRQMTQRYLKMKPKLWRKKGVDILLTHSPAKGFNDGKDMPHMGFSCFNTIIEKYEPKLFVHGHVHMTYGRDFKRESMYNNTKVINAFERYIIEL
jgi:Predicted phosphoesterases, related to the Icc protein